MREGGDLRYPRAPSGPLWYRAAPAPGWLQPPGGTVLVGTNGGALTALPTPGALPTRAQRARTPRTPGLSPGADTGGYGK